MVRIRATVSEVRIWYAVFVEAGKGTAERKMQRDVFVAQTQK